jgi:hypothetical protein
MRLNHTLVAVAGVALIAGIAWLLRDDETPTQQDALTTDASGADVATTSAKDSDALNQRSAAGAPLSTPRPPHSTPVPELWTRLGPAARAGDAPSACILAIETLRCDLHHQSRTFSETLSAAPPDGELAALEAAVADPTGLLTAIGTPSRTGAAVDERRHRLEADIDAHCGNVATERRSEAFALLRQAALAGVPDAQVTYVGAFTGMLQPGALADPTFEHWMDEVPTVMARMLDAGHSDAPALFAEAYGRDAFHGHLFPHDLMRSVAYGQLDQRIGNDGSLASRFVAIRRQALTSAQRAEADQLTAQLHAAHYSGRPQARNERRSPLLYTIYAGRNTSNAARATECEPNSRGTDPR